MDDTNKLIIQLLKDDGRMSFTEIGEILGISRVAVRKRVNRLEEEGIIQGYKAIIKNDASVKMIMDIYLTGGNYDHLIKYLKCTNYVTELCIMKDKNRIHIMAMAPDVSYLEYLAEVVRNKFSDIIKSIEKNSVEETIKDAYGGVKMVKLNEEVANEMNKYLDGITIQEIIYRRRELFHYKVRFNSIEIANDIGVLDLSIRSYNCLKRAGINTIGDLINNYDTKPGETSRSQLRKIRNLGAKSAEEIIMNLFYYHFLTLPIKDRAAYMQQLLEENP